MKETKRSGFYYGWVIVAVCFLLMTFAYVSFVSTTSVYVIPVTEAFGIERAQFVLYATIMSLTTVVITSFMGKVMADKNIKVIMMISAFIGAVGFFIFSQAQGVMYFYLGALLLGVGFGNTTTLPVSLLINNWFGGKIKGTAMGVAFIGSGVGGMIMTPLLNNVIQSSGWRHAYVCQAIIMIILIPIIGIFVVKTPEEKGMLRLGETEDEKEEDKEKSGVTFEEAKRSPILYILLVSIVLVIFGSSAVLANSVAFFQECGYNATQAAGFASAALGSLIVGKPIVGFLCDKFGIKINAVLSCVVFALGFLFLTMMPHMPNLVYGYVICYCIGGAAITVCPPLMVNGLFGEKDYGTLVGLVTMATSIGGAFGGMIAAKAYDMTGSYVTFWIIACIAMLVAGLMRGVCFRMKEKNEQAALEK